MSDTVYPIAIVGAGASGMMAAIAASRVRPHSVLLLEKEARVGRKLLATGNGRCNLLNTIVYKGCFHGTGAHLAYSMAEQTPPAEVLALFREIGLSCREESAGRVYPYSGQASAVLDVLRRACGQLGVQTLTEASVTTIKQHQHGFALSTSQGRFFADRVIIAGGGKAAPKLGANGEAYGLLKALGHTIQPPFPALAPLKLPLDHIRGLKGVRTHASLTLSINGKPAQCETGEILFAEYGISGIAAMQMARRVNEAAGKGHKASLSIHLMDEETAQAEATHRAELWKGQPMEGFCTGLLHKQIAQRLLREASISPQSPITEKAAERLRPLLSGWQIPILGTQSFEHAQVTAGGAILAEFDPDTLESLLAPGMYACGEALDVDADCGGYNLLWAWLSGIACGQAAIKALE